MRILVLSKRQYMGKDLLDDAYGRFYELPLELAQLGHAVAGVCASYRARAESETIAARNGIQVAWQALNVPPYSPFALQGWADAARSAAEKFRPDVIWACSDAFNVILGVRLQERLGVPCVVDLYDNFESYGATRIPGVLGLFRSAVRRAAGATCISPVLERYIRSRYESNSPALVLENGVSPLFAPQDRTQCRRSLNLPADAQVIGTAGAIDRARGLDTLFEAFFALSGELPGLHLLLAGPLARGTRIPSQERIHYLGALPHAAVPQVIGAMDVNVICNRRTAFGDYCFPQKLYEAIACAVPPLAANTAGIAELFAAASGHRYEPDSAASLVAGLRGLLARPSMPPIRARSWAEHGIALAAFLETAGRNARSGSALK